MLQVFDLVHGVFGTLLDLLVLTSPCLPWMWDLATHIVARHGSASEYLISIVFAGLSGGATLCMDVPWSLYQTFVIEQRHGFNKQTLRLFGKDLAMTVGLLSVRVPTSYFLHCVLQPAMQSCNHLTRQLPVTGDAGMHSGAAVRCRPSQGSKALGAVPCTACLGVFARHTDRGSHDLPPIDRATLPQVYQIARWFSEVNVTPEHMAG